MSLVEDLADDGLSYDEIIEELEDRGYDADDILEAFADAEYDWQDALLDAIRDHAAPKGEDILDNAQFYADLLYIDISEVYDIYFGYEED